MTKFRTEKDSIGQIKVPKNAYFGAQTQRAIENFQIGWPTEFSLILPYIIIKKAAANIAVVEFIDSFKEDSKEGLPQLIKSVREKIEEDKPQGINVKALNTSDIGKEYLQLLSSVESKLDELAGVAA